MSIDVATNWNVTFAHYHLLRVYASLHASTNSFRRLLSLSHRAMKITPELIAKKQAEIAQTSLLTAALVGSIDSDDDETDWSKITLQSIEGVRS